MREAFSEKSRTSNKFRFYCLTGLSRGKFSLSLALSLFLSLALSLFLSLVLSRCPEIFGLFTLQFIRDEFSSDGQLKSTGEFWVSFLGAPAGKCIIDCSNTHICGFLRLHAYVGSSYPSASHILGFCQYFEHSCVHRNPIN